MTNRLDELQGLHWRSVMTPNPPEEQTSPRTFKEWFRDFWEAEAAGGYTDESVACAAWDARQPEIDRLRAALERIEKVGCSADDIHRDVAREALDG